MENTLSNETERYTDVYVTVRPSTFAVFYNSYDADWWRKKELLFYKAGCETGLSKPVLNCALCTQSAKIYSGLYRPELKMFRLAQWAPWWPLLLTETVPSTVTRWCKNSWQYFPKPALKKKKNYVSLGEEMILFHLFDFYSHFVRWVGWFLPLIYK